MLITTGVIIHLKNKGLVSVDVCLMDSVLASDVKFQLKGRFNHFWQPVSLRKSCIAHILWPAELFT